MSAIYNNKFVTDVTMVDDIPIPVVTGGTGDQKRGPINALSVDAPPPTHDLRIANVMDGLATTHPKNFGGEVPAAILAGVFSQMSNDLTSIRLTLRRKEEQLENTKNELAGAKVEIATLKAQSGANKRAALIKQACIFIGTIMSGVGVDLYKNQMNSLSFLVGAAGLSLVVIGFLSGKIGGDA